MREEEQIQVNQGDELIVPLEQTEETSVPGVVRIKPNDTLREWAKRQAAIKIA